MKSNPLPTPFVDYLRSLILSGRFTNIRRLHRGLILRWALWRDGVGENAIPGYSACPPAGRNDLPAGSSYRNFQDIAREAIGTPAIHATRKRAASLNR